MFKEMFISRLREPSTYAGLGVIVGALGLALSSDQVNAITTALAALGGLIAVFMREKQS